MTKRSRVVLTIGGVSVGIGVIVLLVSFGYGLQAIVTQKLIWPEALRVAEVSSESVNLKINEELIKKVKDIAGVEKVAASVRLAGQVSFRNSIMDVVVVGAGNEFLNLSDMKIINGGQFSKEADKKYLGDADILKKLGEGEGEVAGVETEAVKVSIGDTVSPENVWFRVEEDAYVPLYRDAKKTAEIVGFVRGNISQNRKGVRTWGAVYEDISGKGRQVNPEGVLMGQWLKAKLPLWQDLGNGIYRELGGEGGSQKEEMGYLSFSGVKVLSSEEVQVEVLLETGKLVVGEVLGETTVAAWQATSAAELKKLGFAAEGTAAGELAARIEEKKKEERLEEGGEVRLQVWPDNEKQIMVSQSLLQAWSLKTEEAVGNEVEVQYLVTSSIVPDVRGRVLSERVKYKIVGVVAENLRPLVYVPIGDVESLGVKQYSNLRVMAKTEKDLAGVRTVIQAMGLVTRSVVDTLSQIVKLFRIIRFLLGSLGAIALAVALLGMFNTLTVSLLERTREIGVMKSLGTTNLDVVRVFMTESVTISLTGGILGLVAGYGVGSFVDEVVFKSAERGGQSLFVTPWWFTLFVVLTALGLGIVTGMYPARRAARISALNALRYE